MVTVYYRHLMANFKSLGDILLKFTAKLTEILRNVEKNSKITVLLVLRLMMSMIF
jgi:hypothetical protein